MSGRREYLAEEVIIEVRLLNISMLRTFCRIVPNCRSASPGCSSSNIDLKQWPSALQSHTRVFNKSRPGFRSLSRKSSISSADKIQSHHSRVSQKKPSEDQPPIIPIVKPSRRLPQSGLFQIALTRKPEYPEGYLLYHAGVMRTLLVGVTKVASALLFAYTCTIIVPGFSTPEQPQWIAPACTSNVSFPDLD